MVQVPATLSVLRSRGGLRRMVVAYGIYDVVDIAIWVAIIFYAYDAGGVGLVGIVAVVQLIPAAFLGPALVGLGDRMPRGRALVLSHGAVAIATLATTVAILASAPVPVVVTCSALATIAVAVVRPFHFASIPMLSRTPDDLVSANSLSSVADGFAFFIGPVAAGIGAALVGPALVLSVSSVLAGIATLLCVGLHLGPAAPFEDSGTPSWRGAFSGLGTLWRDWGALALLLVLTTRFVLGGATDVLGVAYADEVLGLSESAAGLIIGAIGIGGVRRRGHRRIPRGAQPAVARARHERRGPGCGIRGRGPHRAAGASHRGTGGVGHGRSRHDGRRPNPAPAHLGRGCAGPGLRRAGGHVAARGGARRGRRPHPRSTDSGPRGPSCPSGSLLRCSRVACLPLLRRLDGRAVLRPHESALLRSIPFLDALPTYELEQLSRRAEWLDVVPGQVVIAQGDVGDRFYVVAEGQFSVSVDGVQRPGALGPGSGFGEIALLHAVPRTATVTADTAGRLLTLGADDFLGGGHGERGRPCRGARGLPRVPGPRRLV